jgi:hypothetical protein
MRGASIHRPKLQLGLVLLVHIVVVAFKLATLARGEVSEAQVNALMAFYNATGGPGWLQGGWGSVSANPCGTGAAWYGLRCSPDGNNVV